MNTLRTGNRTKGEDLVATLQDRRITRSGLLAKVRKSNGRLVGTINHSHYSGRDTSWTLDGVHELCRCDDLVLSEAEFDKRRGAK